LIEPDKRELSAEPMTFHFYLLQHELKRIVPLL
jgi:hypothetical protein